ncbi:hypothetical protein D9M68_652780 [compost metagenome]
MQRVCAQGLWQLVQPVRGQLLQSQVGGQLLGEPLPCVGACDGGEITLHLTDAGDRPGLGQVGAGVELAAGVAQLLQVQGAGGELQLPVGRQLRGVRCAGQLCAGGERPCTEPALHGHGFAEVGGGQVAAPYPPFRTVAQAAVQAQLRLLVDRQGELKVQRLGLAIHLRAPRHLLFVVVQVELQLQR